MRARPLPPSATVTGDLDLALGLADRLELQVVRLLADLVDHLAGDPDGMRLLTRILAGEDPPPDAAPQGAPT